MGGTERTSAEQESYGRRIAAQLAAAEALNVDFHAVISTLADVRDRAADSDVRRSRGDERALEGLSVAVKDVIDTAGHVTTMGSDAYRTHVPEADAAVVERVRERGGVIVSKTNLSEYAMGATSHNAHYGDVANAWNVERVAGGSSGGSAVAVALGLADAALGTDTGGSVIIPAGLNGVSGLRPSFGRVPNRGVLPVSCNFDTVGPIARDVSSVRRLFDAIQGDDPEDGDQPASFASSGRFVSRISAPGSLEGVRVGIVRGEHFAPDEPAIRERLDEAIGVLADLGAVLVDIELAGAEDAHSHMACQMFADFYAVHEPHFEARPDEFGEDLRYRLMRGKRTTGAEYSRSRRWTQHWRKRVSRVFDGIDVAITATTPVSAPPIRSSSMASTTPNLTRFTHPWCLWAGPTLSVPIGAGENSPVGMSISGPPWSDELVMAVGEAFQLATDWHRRRSASSRILPPP